MNVAILIRPAHPADDKASEYGCRCNYRSSVAGPSHALDCHLWNAKQLVEAYRSPITVYCPTCGVSAGKSCFGTIVLPNRFHSMRYAQLAEGKK